MNRNKTNAIGKTKPHNLVSIPRLQVVVQLVAGVTFEEDIYFIFDINITIICNKRTKVMMVMELALRVVVVAVK